MSHDGEKDNIQMENNSMTDIVRDKLEDFSEAPETRTVLPEEKALLRKLDARILPIACLMYLFACASALYSSAFSIRSKLHDHSSLTL